MSDLVEPRNGEGEKGRRIAHYELKEQLGAGGMGVVYRARDLALSRDVALKCPAREHDTDTDTRRRFVREAKAAARISHPNIVSIFEAFEFEGVPWIAMELVPGRSLRDLLRGGVTFSVAQVLEYGAQLSDALHAAHRAHVLHRDVKPNNIVLREDGRPQLLDFGLARYFVPPEDLEWASTVSTSLTDSGVGLGTPVYMSPEQTLGRAIDARTDIFSLGAVLYEMCTGTAAFSGRSHAEVRDKILHQDPVSILSLNSRVPVELDETIRRSVAKDPDERYASAEELRNALRYVQRQSERSTYENRSRIQQPTHGWRGSNWFVPKRYVRFGVALILVGVAGVLAYPKLRKLWRTPIPPAAGPTLPNMLSVVTSPGDEVVSRVSPDGEWVSYSVQRSGDYVLWTRKLEGGEPIELALASGAILGHAWSQQGDEIAALLFAGDHVLLQIVPAFGGPVRRSEVLDASFNNASLVRWIGDSVYIEVSQDALYRFRFPQGGLQRLVDARTDTGMRTHFDVCLREDQAVYTLVQHDDSTTIWVTEIETGVSRRLTKRHWQSYRPRWLGANCDGVVFSSGYGGQPDLWRLSLADLIPNRLTLSSANESVDDTSRDGRVVMFTEGADQQDLWLMDPVSPRERLWRLTADGLRDSWPSAASTSGRIAFQRSKVITERGPSYWDGTIFVSELSSKELRNVRLVLPDGGSPQLSPDGRYISFLRESEDFELHIYDVLTGYRRRVSHSYTLPFLYRHPEWVQSNSCWSQDASRLYFVQESSGVREVRSASVGVRDTSSTLVVSYPDSLRVGDLHIAPGGQYLAYVRFFLPRAFFELILFDRAARNERVLHTFERARGKLLCRGWLEGGQSLLVVEAALNPDFSEHARILAVDLLGQVKVLGEVDRAYCGAAQLSPDAKILYLTKVDSSGAHNIFAFSLRDGQLRRLTDNTVSGVTYSGISVRQDGTLVFSRLEKRVTVGALLFDSSP